MFGNRVDIEKEVFEHIKAHIEDKYRDSFTEEDIDEFMYGFEEVDQEFEDGGRWTNYRITVYKVGNKYIRENKEIPASEMQEGGDFETSYDFVEPKTKTVTYFE